MEIHSVQRLSLMGHESTVCLLLARGAQVNSVGESGSALHASSLKGFVSIAQLLIQAGADVNLAGGYYWNALQAAVYQGHYDSVELLLDAGTPICNEYGRWRDARHAADGHPRIVYLLNERSPKCAALYVCSVRAFKEPNRRGVRGNKKTFKGSLGKKFSSRRI